MKTWEAELFYTAELILGEGALWHEDLGVWLYVDIEGKKLCSIDPSGKTHRERLLDKRVTTVVPAANGRLVVALESSLEALDFESGIREKLVDIEAEEERNRCNDGKCDAAGRFWIGTMNMDGEPCRGALYCYGKTLEKKISGVGISNGICWSADHRRMYYIDSLACHIRVYDFDLATGDLSNEQILVEIQGSGFLPDGMTIDDEGNLWVAIWGAGAVHHYDAHTGAMLGKITVDAPYVTSCAFGGEDLRHLLITTASMGMTPAERERYPRSGSLFIANTGFRGLPANRFRSQE
jgi:sugar lactone lactonase YvrE